MVTARTQNVDGVTYTTTRNVNYPINEVGYSSGDLPAGFYLCKTGATLYTNCGPFDSIASTGQGIAKISTCDGDSGGPVFIQNKGYGITESIYGKHTESKDWWSGLSSGAGTGGDVYCYSAPSGTYGGMRYQSLGGALAWFGATLY